MRCIEIDDLDLYECAPHMINSNMRCIEMITRMQKRPSYPINSNMRCIEICYESMWHSDQEDKQ